MGTLFTKSEEKEILLAIYLGVMKKNVYVRGYQHPYVARVGTKLYNYLDLEANKQSPQLSVIAVVY